MSFLNQIINSMLVFFHDWTNSWGLAIILLTLLIRVLLHPLTVGQTKSMFAMREVQPKLKELQDKFKDKPEELQKRMMALYKDHKINPLGGCLPMLLQMPILFSLFYVLRDVNYGEAGFLWVHSLGQPDQLYLLPILTSVTTYIQMKLTTTDPAQKSMLYVMPFFIGFVSISFPAGLTLYWVVSNLTGYLQQLLINKQLTRADGEGSVAK